MALLRTHANKGNHNEELRKQLESSIRGAEHEIEEWKKNISQWKRELLELDIAPFKIGGYAMCEVPSGRKTKACKCLLECVEGILYVRPVADDGTLSQRHFSIIPIPITGKTYRELLKKVED